jgi:hypothetical protein
MMGPLVAVQFHPCRLRLYTRFIGNATQKLIIECANGRTFLIQLNNRFCIQALQSFVCNVKAAESWAIWQSSILQLALSAHVRDEWSDFVVIIKSALPAWRRRVVAYDPTVFVADSQPVMIVDLDYTTGPLFLCDVSNVFLKRLVHAARRTCCAICTLQWGPGRSARE